MTSQRVGDEDGDLFKFVEVTKCSFYFWWGSTGKREYTLMTALGHDRVWLFRLY